jgi:hypothetical protein
LRAVAAILVAGVLLGHWPELILHLSSDPLLWVARLSRTLPQAVLPGLPGWNDPNAGITTQALGGLAAAEWLDGRVPWWNPFSGVGLPLAAEMQNSALFLPFVLLLALKNGVAALKLAMQLVSAFATFALLRQLGVRRGVATVGALCFALNGTFAWMAHGPMLPVAFLPLMLLGIERTAAGARGGWAWLALGVAYTLLAGFPETAFLDGLFAGCWALLRLYQVRQRAWRALLLRLAWGGGVGLLLALPAVYAFVQALSASSVGVHGAAAGPFLLPRRELALFLTPYAYGTIGFADQWVEAGLMGGFLQLGLLPLALLALVGGRRERGLRWLIAGWVLVMFADMLGLKLIGRALDLIPFFARVIVERYVWPSWELGLVVLAASGAEEWLAGVPRVRRLAPVTVLAAAVAVAIGLWCGRGHIRDLLATAPGYLAYLLGSIGAAALVLAALAALLWGPPSRRRGAALAVMLAVEAIGLASLPLLSGARHATADWDAVRFLRRHLGLARFVSLGPIAPNYGALFGIASVNADYLPVLSAWSDYMQRHLFPGAGIALTPVIADGTELARVMPRRIADYEAVGVKYVAAFHASAPFRELPDPPRLVFHGSEIDIYELASPAPYVAVSEGACTLVPQGREAVVADCAAPARLLRRELFAPGWIATIDGSGVPIGRAQEIFQSVALPAGRSLVRFAYAPPGIGWAWAGFGLGLAGLGAGLISAARRRADRVQGG